MLDRRAMAWLMPMISSREKCLSTPAEMSSPMLSMRIAACSMELMARTGTRALASPLGWVEISFIAPYPVLDHFRDTLGIVLRQHLQMLDLHFQVGARRRQADFRERVELAEHADSAQLVAGQRQAPFGQIRQGEFGLGGWRLDRLAALGQAAHRRANHQQQEQQGQQRAEAELDQVTHRLPL